MHLLNVQLMDYTHLQVHASRQSAALLVMMMIPRQCVAAGLVTTPRPPSPSPTTPHLFITTHVGHCNKTKFNNQESATFHNIACNTNPLWGREIRKPELVADVLYGSKRLANTDFM